MVFTTNQFAGKSADSPCKETAAAEHPSHAKHADACPEQLG
jgi:hypothetical protein